MANMRRTKSTVLTTAAGATLAGLLACIVPTTEALALRTTAPRHRCADHLSGRGPTIKACDVQVRRHLRKFRLACRQKILGRTGQCIVVGEPP
jgi:hypothetical protein